MIHSLRVIMSSLAIHRKQSFARATFRFIVIFQPILFSFLLFMMFKNSHNPNVGEYVVISSGLMTLWSSIIFSSAGDIERERYMGTLESLYASPSDFRIIFFGKVLGNLMLGLFSMFLSFLCVCLYGVKVEIAHPFEFILTFIVTMASFAVISLLMGSLFTLSRNSRMLMNWMEYPIYILCGIVFPIDVLPKFFQYVAYLLSPTWAVEMLRESMIGISSTRVFYEQLGILVFLTIFYLFLVIYLFRKIDLYTRIKGTLGVH